MTVGTEKLVRMAEQIAANMNYTNDSEVVAAKISDHLARFWDPRMLEAIKVYNLENPDSLSKELSIAVSSIQ
jgi:hypothetical protein